jgi:nucleotide-binding universal stress UspA family protein
VADELKAQKIAVSMDHMDERGNAESLMRMANEMDADLMVIVTESSTRMTDFLISPAARTLITHSDLPVLSVRPPRTE